jgi:epoxyqueuosine reductase
LRNSAIALGNFPHVDNLQSLEAGLHDEESLVRGASAWALGKHKSVSSNIEIDLMLKARLEIECDESVVDEIRAAIGTQPKLPS